MKQEQAYFEDLNQMLRQHERAIPFLLLDLDKLDANIDYLMSSLGTMPFRIVVKSLPAWDLVDYIMRRAKTQRLMVFHQPFLTELSSKLDHRADILLGKPMPIRTAQYFYENLPLSEKGFDAFRQIQWLIDTKERLLEYLALAKKWKRPLRINLEIDVGLHRGGFRGVTSLAEALKIIEANKKYLLFSGLMGYDPHVVKLPSFLRSQTKALALANDFYQKCKDHIQEAFPGLWNENLTFNGAGSPTIDLHTNKESPLNEVAVGSALVKPRAFDIPTLKQYQAAAFIATPVLKAFENTTLPALEKWKGLLNFFNKKHKKSYFIYGGFWKADYHFPKGIQANTLFGESTNQTMTNAPESIHLEVDDFVFLRPHQSEFVFLQFGDILTIRKGQMVGTWLPFKH